MNPLIPKPDVLPAAWGYFQGLLMLTFPLHLLLMNALLGATGISLYARLKGGDSHGRLAHELARMLPLLVAFTINFGVAPLLFLQVLFGHFLYTSSVLMAVYWLGVPLLLIVAYFALYLHDFRFSTLGRAGIIPIALAMAIFLVIPFMFTNNMTLMLEPQRWTGYFANRAGTILNTSSPMLWPRYLHFVLGGLAVGGLFVAAFGTFKGRRDAQVGELAVRLGLKLFTALTMVQVAVGFWFLLSLRDPVMKRFMGASHPATALLVIGVLLTLAAIRAGSRGNVALCAALALPLVFLMAFMRDAVRTGYLEPAFVPASLKVVPQGSPVVLFAVTLVCGLLVIAWMISRLKRPDRGV